MHVKRLKKHNASLVQSAREHKRTNAIPWGKLIYLSLVLIAIFKAGSWVYRNSLFIEATGYIFTETSFVETPVPGTIVKINCAVNDDVKRGDPLIYLAGYGSDSPPESRYLSVSSQATIRRRLVEAENEQKIIGKEISLLRSDLSTREQEKKRSTELLKAGAISLSQFNKISQKVKETNDKITLLRTKSNASRRLIAALNIELSKAAGIGNGYNFKSAIPDSIEHWPEDRILHAPIDGKVTAILRKIGEIAQPGEPAVEIASIENYVIKAFFETNAEGEFQLGDQVRVQYGNGDRSLGVVQKIYAAADATPHVFRGQFAAPRNMIVAEILPLEDAPLKHILAMKVRVFVKRSLF
ncbi:HlyD family efflux transporter periplasmic adaptor subunit [candidate division KSB1 bacterium]|nr:HlyD family efflux transporter periplasmic adaptor subunit [candidate division KSB1 bacterium]